MNLLTIEKMSKSYTERMLFDQITTGIGEGDKVGVIGINGTGKSTLLKIIAGITEPDEGRVVRGNQVKTAYLPQNPVFDDSRSILENVIEGKKRDEEHWNLEGEAQAMLRKLGIEDSSVKSNILSGGQKKRAALVRTLLTPANILILDEPTNHLDNEMAQWLEDYLNRFQGAMIMVTHDRYFLDQVTNRIWEIDKGNIYSYDSGYTGYLMRKAEREEMEQAAERKNKSLYRQDLEWMMRGARARSTKQKAHIARFEELKNRKRPEEEKTAELTSAASRLGKKTIELCDISKAYGDRQLITDFNYIFLKNDRIGIVGPNGCGKSTLLKIMNGILKPDRGTVEIGDTVKIGYFSQENESMDDKLKVIDYIRSAAEYVDTGEGSATASQMLERFLFTGAMQYSPVGKLSGGEKRRLYLLRVLMEAPNIIILDEPTNDLDIRTLTILEDYLDSFPGIVITVSHDRYFLDRVVKRIFSFEQGGRIERYEGGYSDYKEAYDRKYDGILKKEPEPPEKKAADWKTREKKLKFTYQEQKDYDTIEEAIGDLEGRLAALEGQIEQEASNYSRLHELMKTKETLEEELEERMERWMYLCDLAERIESEKNRV